ncbi:MAG: RraA family protein [Methanobrevibacter sp.]|jgi:regulator of RNase E activity RraA|nr:RraA family protein [Methanobrevibacter sp.]
MKNSKLSAKSFLKELNNKKQLKSKNQEIIGGMAICKEDFSIENLNSINYSKSSKSSNPSKDNSIAYENLKNLLDSTSSCQISDALSQIAGRNGVLKGIKAINGKKAYGKVVTVKTNSDDWGTSLFGIDEANKGDILVILSIGESSAIWGELTSTCAQKKEIAGTIIIGATRDIDYVKRADYPVFAKDIVPNAGKSLGLGHVNVDLNLNETKICPGDFVFADESGVVLIPQNLFQETILKTLEIKIKEIAIIEEIEEGKSLSEIVRLK